MMTTISTQLTDKTKIYSYLDNSNGIKKVLTTPDGKYIISENCDNIIQLWDALSGNELNIFEGNSLLDMTPDGKYIFVDDYNITKQIDIKTTKVIKTFDCYGFLKVIQNGKSIISKSDEYTVKLWDIDSKKEIKSICNFQEEINNMIISNDEKHLILYFDNTEDDSSVIKIVDIKTISIIYEFNLKIRMLLAADNKYIYYSSVDNNLEMLDIDTKTPEPWFEHINANAVNSFILSPDDKYIYFATQKQIKQYNMKTYEINIIIESTQDVLALSLTNDGKQIVLGAGNASSVGIITIHDLTTKALLTRCIKTYRRILAIALMSDGNNFISAEEDTRNPNTIIFNMWNIKKGFVKELFSKYMVGILSLAVSPDGKYIYCLYYEDYSTTVITKIELGDNYQKQYEYIHIDIIIMSICISKCGKYIICTGTDNNIIVVDIDTNEEIKNENDIISSKYQILSTSILIDGRIIFYSQHYNTIKIIDMESKEELYSFKINRDWCLQLSMTLNERHILSHTATNINILSFDPICSI